MNEELKLSTINVILIEDNVLTHLESFKQTEKGRSLAEEDFKQVLMEKHPTMSFKELSSAILDGSFSYIDRNYHTLSVIRLACSN